MNNDTYHLQFAFRQKYSIFPVFIYAMDEIRDQLDSDNFACEIVIDLQRAFDTVDHAIPFFKVKVISHFILLCKQ